MAIEKRYLDKRRDGDIVRDAAGEPVPDLKQPRYRPRIAVIDPTTGKRCNVTVGTFRTKGEAEAAILAGEMAGAVELLRQQARTCGATCARKAPAPPWNRC